MGWDLLHHQALDLITSEVGEPLMSRSVLSERAVMTHLTLISCKPCARQSCILRHDKLLCRLLAQADVLPDSTGHSDDERGHFRGSDVGRSDSGEVEMMEFDRQGLPRRSSASTLDEQAGTRAGLILFSSLAAAAAACRQHCQIAWQCSPPLQT